ncbi:MAG: hypothetical protein ACPGUD_10495 [Parashewanella sp.]
MSFSFPVFIRMMMAFIGGYGVAVCSSLGMIPISLWLFTDNPHDAVYIGMMCSYLFYFIAVIYCFSCKTQVRAIIATLSSCAFFLAIYWLFPTGVSL